MSDGKVLTPSDGMVLDIGMSFRSEYALAAAPKFAGMRVWDCEICHREELARPVFLTAPGGRLISAGTGCASVALYGRRDPRLAREVRKAADAATYRAEQAARGRRERSAGYVGALADFTAWRASHNAAPSARQMQVTRTFHACRTAGYAGNLPEFMASVILTGELPQ